MAAILLPVVFGTLAVQIQDAMSQLSYYSGPSQTPYGGVMPRNSPEYQAQPIGGDTVPYQELPAFSSGDEELTFLNDEDDDAKKLREIVMNYKVRQFEDVIENFVDQELPSITHGEVESFDAYGHHPKESTKAFQIDTEPFYRMNYLQKTLDHPYHAWSKTRWYHNPDEDNITISFTETIDDVEETFSWVVENGIELGKEIRLVGRVPCEVSPHVNIIANFSTTKSNSFQATNAKNISGFFVISVPPQSSIKLNFSIFSREALAPFWAEVVIKGFVLICFNDPYQGSRCWGWPVHDMENSDFIKDGNHLKSNITGWFRGTFVIAQKLFATEYEFQDVALRQHEWVEPAITRATYEVPEDGVEAQPEPIPSITPEMAATLMQPNSNSLRKQASTPPPLTIQERYSDPYAFP